jgi:hypothetical protein
MRLCVREVGVTRGPEALPEQDPNISFGRESSRQMVESGFSLGLIR